MQQVACRARTSRCGQSGDIDKIKKSTKSNEKSVPLEVKKFAGYVSSTWYRATVDCLVVQMTFLQLVLLCVLLTCTAHANNEFIESTKTPYVTDDELLIPSGTDAKLGFMGDKAISFYVAFEKSLALSERSTTSTISGSTTVNSGRTYGRRGSTSSKTRGTTGQHEISASYRVVELVVVVVVAGLVCVPQRMTPVLFPLLLLCCLHSAHAMEEPSKHAPHPHSPKDSAADDEHSPKDHAAEERTPKHHEPKDHNVQIPCETCEVRAQSITWLNPAVPVEAATVFMYPTGEDTSIAQCTLTKGSCSMCAKEDLKGHIDVKISLSTPLLQVGKYIAGKELKAYQWSAAKDVPCEAGKPLDIEFRIPTKDKTASNTNDNTNVETTDDEGAIKMFENFRKVVEWAESNVLHGTGVIVEPAKVGYPSGKTTTIYPDRILINTEMYIDEFSVLAHEYAHWIRNAVKDVPIPISKKGHDYCMKGGEAFDMAFEEGFANALSVVYTNTLVDNGNTAYEWGFVERIGSTEHRDLEHYSCGLHDMLSDEGRVAAFILDAYDHLNHDDSYTVNGQGNVDYGTMQNSDATSQVDPVSISTVFIEPLRSGATNIVEYWHALRQLLPDPSKHEDALTFNYGNLAPQVQAFSCAEDVAMGIISYATSCTLEKTASGGETVVVAEFKYTTNNNNLFYVLNLKNGVKYTITLTCSGWRDNQWTADVTGQDNDDN